MRQLDEISPVKEQASTLLHLTAPVSGGCLERCEKTIRRNTVECADCRAVGNRKHARVGWPTTANLF
jgi:hypothetical protein